MGASIYLGKVLSAGTKGCNIILPTTAAIDPDAQAFITAAAITDPTQQAAINTLVVDLKGYNVWTKMKALYPIVGGTASSHKFNLKDPRDLDAAFRLTFATGWTHSSTGMLPNGATYADTFLTPSTSLSSQNSTHLSYYSRTNTTYTNALIGVADASYVNGLYLIPKNSPDNEYTRINQSSANALPGHFQTFGLFVGSRVLSTQAKSYRNGSVVNFINVNSSGLANNSIYLGAANFTPIQYTTCQTAFASIGDGLTDTEAANFYTAVQTFQTTLGRSIGTQTVSDADAQAFVTNAGIVDQVEANAVNNLVIGLKADSLWTKMKAVYPFVGGTSTTHSYNLRNTSQFQITWSGGLTHNSQGVTGGGVNGYGNTGLIPSTSLTNNSLNVSVYSRTSTQNGATEMGCSTSGFLPIIGLTTRGANGILFDGYDFSAHRLQVANSDGRGFYHGNILTSTDQKIYKNGLQVATNSVAQTQTQPSVRPLFILARNDSGTPANYSDKNLAFASIGDGLTDTEATNFYNRVQTFNTSLARQV